MEEQVPPPEYRTLLLPTAASSHETYLIQFPRDTVHRVPPPEHARIIEDHARQQSSPSGNICRKIILWTSLSLLLVVLVVVALIHVVRAAFPIPPEFSVRGIQVKNLERFLDRGRPEAVYTVAMQVRNRNAQMAVSYKGGGAASLILKKYTIGRGRVQTSFRKNGAVSGFKVTASGKKAAAVTKRDLKGSAVKNIQLKTVVPVEIRSWVRTVKWNMKINCEFKVKNSLIKSAKTKIADQKCRAEH